MLIDQPGKGPSPRRVAGSERLLDYATEVLSRIEETANYAEAKLGGILMREEVMKDPENTEADLPLLFAELYARLVKIDGKATAIRRVLDRVDL